MAIALLMGLLIGAGATYAIVGPTLSRTTTVTVASTTTVTTESAQEIRSAYVVHLQNVKSENLSAIGADYEENATLTITGSASSLAGQYEGVGNISTYYQVLFSHDIGFLGTVNLANESYSVNVSRDSREATVNSNFTIYGNDTGFSYRIGPSGAITEYRASITADASYVRVGNNWLISSETLDFLSFDICGILHSAMNC